MTMASHFAVQAPAHGYKISKTALNMLNLQWALEYQEKGFTFLNISPGVSLALSSSSSPLSKHPEGNED